ncbi:adenylate cyclase type 2-like isoform X1 [Vespula squamosa]|uniref:Adenylate cyclase type 2-like isoform X1 n=1 Tax=Vespula squamosa TaxID=30214 RepID=A0ABD2C3E4_VESSQ
MDSDFDLFKGFIGSTVIEDAERLKENPTGITTDESGVEQLQILRDKYEGKLTTSLYTGTLFVASVASILALGAICLTNYKIN